MRVMASKKDVLSQLTRAELLAFVSEAGVEVADRRVREQLIAALSGSRRARPAEFLTSFSAERLKQIADSVGSAGGARNKAAIIEAITSAKSAGGRATARSEPTARTRQRRAPSAVSAAPLRATKAARTTRKTKSPKA
jgi:hypothetical protein